MMRVRWSWLLAVALAAALAMAPGSATAACVGGVENGNLQAGEDCDGNGDTNDCCTSTCTFAADNTLCDDNNDCSVNTKCDASGDCGGGTGAPNGTHCQQRDVNGNAESCMEYLCQGKACTDTLVEDPCSDDNPCTDDICTDPNNQTCDPVHPPKDEGDPCDTDSDVCTIEKCDAEGACELENTVDCSGTTPAPGVCEFYACDPVDGSCDLTDKPKGTSCTTDNNDCTDDECNARGDCKHFGVPAGTPCNDGNECSIGEQCNAHKECGKVGTPYVGTPPNDCRPCTADNNGCTYDYCQTGATVCAHSAFACSGSGTTNGVSCVDNNACSDASACSSGSCVPTSCLSTGVCDGCQVACNGTLPGCGCQ